VPWETARSSGFAGLLGKSARVFCRDIVTGPDFIARVEYPLYTGRQAALKTNSAQRAQKHHKRLRIEGGAFEDSQNENIQPGSA
jgi:hypothetical protein